MKTMQIWYNATTTIKYLNKKTSMLYTKFSNVNAEFSGRELKRNHKPEISAPTLVCRAEIRVTRKKTNSLIGEVTHR
jgi:hypothetical protein